MSNYLTVVTYHFVRDLKHTRWPEIKGLLFSDFVEQIAFMQKHYNIIMIQDLLAALDSRGADVPPRPLVLTFDDGYIDHFINVFPILDDAGVQGCFFPPAKAILENQVLDVNKIHFILASVTDKSLIIGSIFKMMDEYRSVWKLRANKDYYREYAVANRFDSAEVIFIKRILQRGLPKHVRQEFVDKLFKQYVSEDEGSFSRELYMTDDQLKCMARNGMYVGSHGFSHEWLDTLSREDQIEEIDLSLRFLASIGGNTNDWVMSYPYGAYNDSLVEVLRQKGCKAAFTTEQRLVTLDKDNRLILPRLDTNDLPKERHAEKNDWTDLAVLQ